MSNSVNIVFQSLLERINSTDANDGVIFFDSATNSVSSIPGYTYNTIGYPTLSFVQSDTVISRIGSSGIGCSPFFAITRDEGKTGSASLVFESGFVTEWLLGTDNGGSENFNIYNYGESSFELSLSINKETNKVIIPTLSPSQTVMTDGDNYLISMETYPIDPDLQSVGGILYVSNVPDVESNANFTFNGLNSVILTSPTTTTSLSVVTAVTGSTNNAVFNLQRGDQTNGSAQLRLFTSTTQLWQIGLRPNDNLVHFYDSVNSLDRMTLDQSGNVNIPGLIASAIIYTDGSKNLKNTTDFSYNPTTSNLSILTANATPTLTVRTTLTGTTNDASINVSRGDVTNGSCLYQTLIGTGIRWSNGNYRNGLITADGNDYIFRSSSSNGGAGNTLSLNFTTADVILLSGNLIINTVNKGIQIKAASVSAGTANASFCTNVTLVGGTVTVNNSFVTTSCSGCVAVVTAGGTPGTGYRLNIGSGTFTVTSSSALDTSTLTVTFFKGF